MKAEEAAWAVAEKEGLDLVVLLPSQVLGPVLDSSPATFSVQWFKVCNNPTVPALESSKVASAQVHMISGTHTQRYFRLSPLQCCSGADTRRLKRASPPR